MLWYPLTTREALLLLFVFVLSGIFSNLQPYFVAAPLRPFTYIFCLLLLLLAFFPVAGPADPIALAKFLAVLLGAIFAVVIVVKDVILRQNLSWNIAVVLAGVVLSPLVAGWCYSLTVRRPVREK